jgi:hypothetical protein
MSKIKLTPQEIEHMSAMACRFGVFTYWMQSNPKVLQSITEELIDCQSPYEEGKDYDIVETLKLIPDSPRGVRTKVIHTAYKHAIEDAGFQWCQNQIVGREHDNALWDSIEQNEALIGKAASEHALTFTDEEIAQAKEQIKEKFGEEAVEKLESIFGKMNELVSKGLDLDEDTNAKSK